MAVREMFCTQIVWEGVMEAFELHAHPEATRCYAWSHAVEGSKKRRYVAVLHQGPVDSPQAAVRAAVAEEFRGRGASDGSGDSG